MRISEVTTRSGAPATTLRYYEDLGLIHSKRSTNGYRDYHSEVLEQLSFIDTAKKMDLDLSEIKWLLEVTETGTCTSTREALRPVLTDRLSQVEDSITRLTTLRDRLARSLEDVATCADSPEPCKSECAFKALTETSRGKSPTAPTGGLASATEPQGQFCGHSEGDRGSGCEGS